MYSNSFHVTEDGRCWSFGDGQDNQLGIPKRWRATVPMHVDDNIHLANGRTLAVSAGYLSSYAVTGDAPQDMLDEIEELKKVILDPKHSIYIRT